MRTLLVAHPDDEVIFFWWALKEIDQIVCCSSDLNNPERAWCKDRCKALFEIGNILNIPVTCLDYNSEFYRLNSRNGELLKLQSDILAAVEGDIYTHNAWGEYAHLDHILVNQIAKTTGCMLLTTDIVIDGGWFKVENLMTKEPVFRAVNDLDLYAKCKAIYDKWGCWTWSKEPVHSCGVYEI